MDGDVVALNRRSLSSASRAVNTSSRKAGKVSGARAITSGGTRGELTLKGKPREQPREQPREKANKAYVTLQDDAPVSEGTWVVDSKAQGGWRWAEKAHVYQVLQAEATPSDPYARAHLAQQPLVVEAYQVL